MHVPFLLAAALAAAGTPSPVAVLPETGASTTTTIAPAPPPAPPKLMLPKGTMVRLMVLNEVNSRDHKLGDRFVLRVDEEVKAGATTVIPTGAMAWSEVVSAEGTGGVGKSGKLNAKLLYVEAGGQKIALQGERNASGGNSTGAVVAGVVAFGIFGLLMKGNNAKLKAGEILNGYTVDDASFEQQALAAHQ